MSWEDLQGSGIRAEYSPVESDRFGISTGRVIVGYQVADSAIVSDDLVQLLRQRSEELLILRWPAALTRLAGALHESGRWLLPADTLTYWEVPALDLSRIRLHGDDKGLAILDPSEVDEVLTQDLAGVVEDSFAGYGNHYSANPLLDATSALAGYRDWAIRTLRANPADVVVLTHQARAVGVATTALSCDGSDLEILLAGMATGAQARGWYAHLLRGVGLLARRRGAERVVISTQVHNVRVQRAWCRVGLRPFAAVSTLHAIRESG